jgi:hypothetical protein
LLPDADDVAGRIAEACYPQVTFGVSRLHHSSAVSSNLVEDLAQIRDVDVRSDASVFRYLKISAPMTVTWPEPSVKLPCSPSPVTTQTKSWR